MPPFLFMTSELLLDFPDTGDVRTLRVNDSSFYNPNITVECGLLQVTAPGYIESINFDVDKAFSIVLNSSNLRLAKVKIYRDLTALPDGIYTFKYSINPNERLWVEYDTLRVNNILQTYYSKLCAVKILPSPNSKEIKAKLKELREIKSFIDVAVAEVGVCGNRNRGMELYKYAQELLNVCCKAF